MNVRVSGACAPVTADRARATRLDSRPVINWSDEADLSIDRCVDTR
ncbi:Uncharacterised protein [Mycobacterium tuberculosis]|nr:Uncharacterised protein [Mycobacterium tuberculosis]CPB45941.1 Uncharacterised protein [Mycobacterium tuberculosis]